MSEEIKIVKTASCPSLSGNSTITYELGSQGDQQFIRLSGNSAGGLFCKEWVTLELVEQLISGSPKLTSKILQPLYAGKSSNSAGFLLACMINEKQCANSAPAVPHPESIPRKSAKKNEESSS